MRIAGLVVLLLIAGKAIALEPIQTIPLPGIEGRIDHFSMDVPGKRLFVCALGNDSVEVIDLASGKVVQSIHGLEEPQGVAYLPEINRLVVANGGDGSCRFFDATTFVPKESISLSSDADNVRYDAKARRLYVGYGDGGLAVIDPKTAKVTGDIPVGAHPESFQLETNGPLIFVNVPNSREIAVLDRTTRSLKAKWSLGFERGNFPMALDEASRRLFVACRLPARLLVFDIATGRQMAEAELHGDCDDLFDDPVRHKIYASCGEGFLDVFGQTDDGKYHRENSIKTAGGARTCWFDGQKLYLAVPHRGPQGAELRIYKLD